MANDDELLRAFALISSLKENIPDDFEVSADWVIEYHNALDKVEKQIGKSLTEFRVQEKNLKRLLASGNYLTGEMTYTEGLWCERSILLQKVGAVLTYLQLLLKPPDKTIGFRT